MGVCTWVGGCAHGWTTGGCAHGWVFAHGWVGVHMGGWAFLGGRYTILKLLPFSTGWLCLQTTHTQSPGADLNERGTWVREAVQSRGRHTAAESYLDADEGGVPPSPHIHTQWVSKQECMECNIFLE